MNPRKLTPSLAEKPTVKHFNPSTTHSARAVQTWQILVGKAMNRQTVTYEGLSEIIFRKKAAGVLSRILGLIAFYCKDHGIPPLTSIVVGVRRGTPGAKIPLALEDVDGERELVFVFDWYDVYPPSEKESLNTIGWRMSRRLLICSSRNSHDRWSRNGRER